MSLHAGHPETTNLSHHQALHHDQIRILILNAGLPGSPLEASLQTISLSDLINRNDNNTSDGLEDCTLYYEAISYCWGEPVFPKSCKFADGGEMLLTESLHSALQAFRYPDRSRSLWADAVCIDQANTSERSSQVELMGDIFAKATRVLVWLGDPLDCGSDTLAFAALNMPITPQGDRSRKELLALMEQHLPYAERCACCNEAVPDGTPVTLASGLTAIAKLLERPFFQRLWVVQEIVFAQAVEVYCGRHHAPWEMFTELSRVPGQYQGDQEYIDQQYTTAIPRAELRKVWAQTNYLNQLRSRHRQRKTDTFRPTELCKDLLMMSKLQCRNPHDRIFGVSRVLGLRDIPSLRADYTLSVAEVYRRVAEVYITAQANRPGGHAVLLLALTSTEAAEAKFLARPSWVPDLQHLSERSRAKNTYYQWAFAERQFYADAALFRCYISPEKPLELCIRGRCFGEITALLETSQCPSKHTHRRSGEKCPSAEGVELLRWHARCRRFLEQYAYIDSVDTDDAGVVEKLDAIFSCDRAKDGASLHVETISKWLDEDSEDMDTLDLQSVCRQLKPYITGYPVDRDRLLCIANCGSRSGAGWVPSDAKIGDQLCQFAGSPYPFLVREDVDGRYKLLGDAFMTGVTEAEVLGLDDVVWSSHLTSLRTCDGALKSWMQSEARKEMKVEKNNGFNLSKRDEQFKTARQDAIDRLKDFYRQSDDDLVWICLR